MPIDMELITSDKMDELCSGELIHTTQALIIPERTINKEDPTA